MYWGFYVTGRSMTSTGVVLTRQELRQARWLEQVNGTLIDTEAVSFDVLRDLLDTGTTLPQKPGLYHAPRAWPAVSVECVATNLCEVKTSSTVTAQSTLGSNIIVWQCIHYTVVRLLCGEFVWNLCTENPELPDKTKGMTTQVKAPAERIIFGSVYGVAEENSLLHFFTILGLVLLETRRWKD